MEAKEKAAPIAAGRPDINNLEGIEMHYQFSSDDLEVEIGELIEQYSEGSTVTDGQVFGVFSVQRFTVGGTWSATMHVDDRFTGNHVEMFVGSKGVRFFISASGTDLCEVLRNVRNYFVESAPAEKAA